MRIKHLLTLNQKENPPSWKNLATYWLSIDIQNYSKEYKFLMNNNRIKSVTRNKPFYYKDIVNYIKNQNKNISKIKPQTKIIYQNIIQEGVKQHKIAGEIQWKNHMPNINFEKIWENTYKSYGQAFIKDIIDCYIIRRKQTCTCINVPKKITRTATTADARKITYTYLYNVPE